MDIRFCARYIGDGHPPTNRFCRSCDCPASEELWQKVVSLAHSCRDNPVPLPPTRAVLIPHPSNPAMARMRVNVTWTLPKEDFLHFISTGRAGMGKKGDRENPRSSPSMARQEPYIRAIVEALGGWDIPEIARVKRIQKGE